MKKINDLSELSPLVMSFFKRGVITNNFLAVKDYRAEIAEGRLFYDKAADFLLIYLKRDGFYQLYFYALREFVKFPQFGAPVICEFSGDDKGILENNGFSVILKRTALEKNAENTGEKIEKASIKDAEAVFFLLEKSFNKYTGCLPLKTQIAEECGEGLIYILKDNEKITGVLRAEQAKKTAKIKHLCTDEAYRGRGIAKKLCNAFLEENAGKKCLVWTGNEYALKLYKSVGFDEKNLKSTVFVKGELT